MSASWVVRQEVAPICSDVNSPAESMAIKATATSTSIRVMPAVGEP